MSDPLPTAEQIKKLNELMAKVFVEIRCLGWAGKSQQIADLADTFHNLPQEMHGIGKWERNFTRSQLQFYQDKYHEEEYSGMINYVGSFDSIFK